MTDYLVILGPRDAAVKPLPPQAGLVTPGPFKFELAVELRDDVLAD
jgi:hypothetical protein